MQMMANHVQDFQERFRQLAASGGTAAGACSVAAGSADRVNPEGVLINMPLSRQDLAE